MTAAPLPVAEGLSFGLITSAGSPKAAREVTAVAERLELDSLWVGDHVAFAVPILDPLLQLAQLATFSSRLELGTSVYLLPLRHPVLAAKQIATLDHLCGGRLVLGVGVGGEFPGEFAACEVPVEERGPRLSESLPLLRALVRGEPVSSEGRFYRFPETRLAPPSPQPEGPRIWCGGRSPGALRRTGRLADGWISYVVTPEMYRDALVEIARAAEEADRKIERFDTAHLLFVRIDDAYEEALDRATEHLSQRYAMDFRRAAQRYAALGRPEDVAERIHAFREAGLRTIVLDLVGPMGDRDAQLERFAREVRPLL